ncbi:MAG: hypothetical protein FWH49_08380 [Clostridiales bacterium]|nr:hypothetical protein [Clostridiales bacterium]MCL2167287.1 hypothetical protein [Clostridiales bacterium]
MADNEAVLTKRPLHAKLWYRLIICTISAALLIAAAGMGAVTMICRGPFPAARERLVTGITETGTFSFLLRLYFTEDQLQKILSDSVTGGLSN